MDRDRGRACGVRDRCERDRAVRSAAAERNAGVGDHRRVAGRGGHGEAAGRCFDIADGERNRGRGGVFVGRLIRHVRDGRQIVHRVDRDVERVGGDAAVGVGDLNRDRGRTRSVGDRCERDRAIGSAAAQRDARIRDHRRVAGSGGHGEATGRRFDIADGERNRGRGCVFVGGLVGNVRDGRQIVDRIDRDVERVGGDAAVGVGDLDRDRGRAGRVGDRCEGDRAVGAAAAQRDAAVGDHRRVAGGGGDNEAGGRCFEITDGERNGGRRGIFVRGLIGDVRDGGQIVDRIDRDVERVGGDASISVGDLDRDRGRASGVRDGCERDRAIRSATAERDAGVGDHGRVAGRGGDGEAAGGRFDIADGEWNGRRGGVFVGRLIRHVRDGGQIVHRVDRDVERVGGDAAVGIGDLDRDRRRTRRIGNGASVIVRLVPLPPSVMPPLAITAVLLDVAVTTRLAAGVSRSPTVNGMAAVEVSSFVAWLATSEMVGKSFDGSDDDIERFRREAAVSICHLQGDGGRTDPLAAGVTVTVRFAPLPPSTMFALGTSDVLLEVAVTVKLPAAVSTSPTVKARAEVAVSSLMN